MLKNQKGITLVALVITIIVLLILAGVTISLVIGDNGLITRAQEAENAGGALSDNVTVALGAVAIDVLSDKIEDTESAKIEALEEELGKIYTTEEMEDINVTATKVTRPAGSKTETVTIDLTKYSVTDTEVI